ncbi:MAG: ABC transporter permease subunit [Thermoanaerobaculia bacterium]
MRRLVDRLFRLATGLCALGALGLLTAIAFTLVARGLPALGRGSAGSTVGASLGLGGVLYPFLGTLLLVMTALLVATPLATALALLESVYLRGGARRGLRIWLYVANAVPSILFGIFGLLFFVMFLDWGKSWLAGGIVLGLMILPTITVSLAERIAALPTRYRRAAAGLGLTRSQIIWAVLLPQSWGGLVSGALLGLARAAGETAPIMFTAVVFAGATLPDGVRDSPVLALPYHIFVLAQDSFDPAAQTQLWAAASVLLALVFGLSLLTLPVRLRLSEEARNG